MPEPASAPPETFLTACRALPVELSTDVVNRLATYLEVLLDANRAFNLTAVRDRETAWHRHILDSLSLLPMLTAEESVIDVGSGGGLPGLVLAIADPERPVCLLEATGKKARFLAQTAATLGLSHVSVLADRAETAAHNPAFRESFDVAVARAVADLPALLECTAPFVRKGGRVLAMKGKGANEEMSRSTRAQSTLGLSKGAIHLPLPAKDRDACIVAYHKVRSTPTKYPRHPGTPAKRPL